MVYDIHPNVFMTVTETAEIYGHFRKKKGSALTAQQVGNYVVSDAQKPIVAQVELYEHKVNVINHHGKIVDETVLKGEYEDGQDR